MLDKKFFAVILSCVAIIATPAFADDDDDDDDDYRPKKVQTYKPKQAQSGRTNIISAQKAGQLAQDSLKNSRVHKVKYDHDDYYGAIYEVELFKGRLKYEVKVNAKTGEVINVKRDN